MQQLCVLCGVGPHELLPCKMVLFEYFNTTYPKAAEAAEKEGAAAVLRASSAAAAASSNRFCSARA